VLFGRLSFVVSSQYGNEVKLKDKAWKYVTAFVVVLIILNPEMIELALFIDAVGLEIFLMLFEVQVLVIIGSLLNNKIKPAISRLKLILEKCLLTDSLRMFKEGTEYLTMPVPSEAALMHLLVVSAVISGALGVQL
jgi:hypothetical protein